jgi:hypothetical protein
VGCPIIALTGIAVSGNGVSEVETRGERPWFVASTHALFEIILILSGFTGGALARRLPEIVTHLFSPGFARPDFPVCEMKTLPEKPATSFVLFETARSAVSAGYPRHVGFETSVPGFANSNYPFVNTLFSPSFLAVAHSLQNV